MQVQNQKFSWNSGTGKFSVVGPNGSASSDCLTVGDDKDPDSRTPAVEVQPCSSALDAKQRFVHNAASNQLSLAADGGCHCFQYRSYTCAHVV